MYPTNRSTKLDMGRISKLKHPDGQIRAVIDTDTFNEIDDQFAVSYALLSGERMKVEALYAAPFFNKMSSGPADGMEKSYKEIHKLLGHLKVFQDQNVFRGSKRYLSDATTPVDSEAARDLVQRALRYSSDDPLYVVAIGAPTNVVSAMLMEPQIIDNIVVVWLGGHALHWPNTYEFNLYQDIHASRFLLDCGVPLVLIPCMGAASHLITSLAEIRSLLTDCGSIGNYLIETFEHCTSDHFAHSRVIWDLSAIAYLINEEWVPSNVTHSPILNDNFTWSFDSSRHLIRVAHYVRRDEVFRDVFTKIREAVHAENRTV